MDELEKIRAEVEKVISTVEFNSLLGKVSGNFESLIGKSKMRTLAPMLLAFLESHEPDGRRTELPIILTSLPDGEEKLAVYRRVRDQIRAFVESLPESLRSETKNQVNQRKKT